MVNKKIEKNIHSHEMTQFWIESPSGLDRTNWYESLDQLMGRSSNRQRIGSITSTNPNRVQVSCYWAWISRVGLYHCNTQSHARINTHTHGYTCTSPHAGIHKHYMFIHSDTYIQIHTFIYIRTLSSARAHTHTQ